MARGDDDARGDWYENWDGHGPWLGEIQCKTGLSLEKMKNFQNEATDFNFIFLNLKLLIGATNAEGPEKYSTFPFRILGPSKFTDSV